MLSPRSTAVLPQAIRSPIWFGSQSPTLTPTGQALPVTRNDWFSSPDRLMRPAFDWPIHPVVGISLLPTSPYHTANVKPFYPTVNSETSSANGQSRRHFKRRVAQYHHNQRRNSQPRASNIPNSLQIGSTDRLNNSTSPTTRIAITKSVDQRLEQGRSMSVGPALSSGHTDKCSRPNGEVTLNRLSGNLHDSSIQSRANSTPLMNPQLTLDSNTRPSNEINQSSSRESSGNMRMHHCAVRSRSHHQLLPTTKTSIIQTTTSEPLQSDQESFKKGILTAEQAAGKTDEWCQKYYAASIQSDYYTGKVMRSPISVLAPCKGKNTQVSVVPDKTNSFTQETKVMDNASNPFFNQTIVVDLTKSRHGRRILLSIFCQRDTSCTEGDVIGKNPNHEFLGGMSFGVSGVLAKKQICGWYYLLNELMARKKHLKASPELVVSNTAVQSASTKGMFPSNNEHATPDNSDPRSTSVSRNQIGNPRTNILISPHDPTSFGSNIARDLSLSCNLPTSVSPMVHSLPTATLPTVNPAMESMQLHRFTIARGPKGFGFTLSGQYPVHVSHVEPRSPAMHSGVQAGDSIIAVDRLNMTQCTADSVVRLFRSAQTSINLTICRPINLRVRLPSVGRQNCGSRTISNLFQKGCLSSVKKSNSTDSFLPDRNMDQTESRDHCVHPNEAIQTPSTDQVGRRATLFHYPRMTPCNQRTAVSAFVTTNNGSIRSNTSCLTNSRSYYHLTTTTRGNGEVQQPRGIRNSQTDSQLCEAMERGGKNHTEVPVQQVAYKPIPVIPNYSGIWEAHVDMVTAPTVAYSCPECVTIADDPSRSINSPPTVAVDFTLPISIGTPAEGRRDKLTDSSTHPTWINLGSTVIDRLKYVNHVKQVDFRLYSPRLERYGCLNLLESNNCSKVDLLLFTDLLLIAQRAPNRYFTVIKDPIYTRKMCYINIPPNAADQLILQYIDDTNRKRIVHFQGTSVHNWLTWIQSHMIYNSNWWMGTPTTYGLPTVNNRLGPY